MFSAKIKQIPIAILTDTASFSWSGISSSCSLLPYTSEYLSAQSSLFVEITFRYFWILNSCKQIQPSFWRNNCFYSLIHTESNVDTYTSANMFVHNNNTQFKLYQYISKRPFHWFYLDFMLPKLYILWCDLKSLLFVSFENHRENVFHPYSLLISNNQLILILTPSCFSDLLQFQWILKKVPCHHTQILPYCFA